MTLVYSSKYYNADLSPIAVATTAAAPAATTAAASAPATALTGSYVLFSTKLVAEAPNSRALTGASTTSSTEMTPQFCADFCATKGFYLSGTEYTQECYCGSSLVNGVSPSCADLDGRK